MAQLPRRPAPAQHLAPVKDGPADAGADGQHHHVLLPLRRAIGGLAQQGHGGVILDGDGQAGGGFNFGREIKAREVDIAARQHAPCRGVHLPRHADAKGCDLIVADLRHQIQNARHHFARVGGTVRGRAGLDHAAG